MNFDDIYDISDENGRSIATSVNIKIGNSEFKNFKIRPTLVGHEFYTQIVNELINKEGKKKLSLLTLNEEGKLISK